MEDIVTLMRKQPDFYAMSGASNNDIELAEHALGVRFATDYRQYVESLGTASFDGHELTGICKSERLNVVSVTQKERHVNRTSSPNWYVVEQLNIDAITIWQCSDGEIYLLQPGIAPRWIANGLADYLHL